MTIGGVLHTDCSRILLYRGIKVGDNRDSILPRRPLTWRRQGEGADKEAGEGENGGQ